MLPFSAVVRLHGVDVIGPRLLLFTLVLVWVGDTAAYFVGRGIRALEDVPRNSAPTRPGRARWRIFWEPCWWARCSDTGSKIPPAHMLGWPCVGSIAGQIGDLFESALKRSAGVKDSGTILPGHGGMLDRIDALILAAPAVWYYFEWVVLKKY